MRALAQFDDAKTADRLAGVLAFGGIEARVERTRAGLHTVWVMNEAELAGARAVLAEFEVDPEDPKFAEKARKARERQKAERAKASGERRSQPPARRVRLDSLRPTLGSVAPVTVALIGICVFVYLLIELVPHVVPGVDGRRIAGALWFAKNPAARSLGFSIPEAMEGEWWRLVTPIFMHASPGRNFLGILHIVFNMLWLKDLGRAVEGAHGKRFFLGMVLGAAVLSNSAQYLAVGPNFAGMSGVVYALFGFMWLRERFDPRVPYRLPDGLKSWMMLWFVACFLGLMGPVANMAHAGGLVFGALAGFVTAKRARG